jgi:cytochrome c peroxidase
VNNQVPLLIGSSLNGLSLATPNTFNAGESDEQDTSNDYGVQILPDTTFQNSIQTKLTALGSSLTPANIVDRATTQSCAGCHDVSNGDSLGGGLTWPSSNNFTHISESRTLSPALTGTFLPHRANLLATFLEVCTP